MREDEVVQRLDGQPRHVEDFDHLVGLHGILQTSVADVGERVDRVGIEAAEFGEENGVLAEEGPNEPDFFEVLSENVEESDVFAGQERKADDDQVAASLQDLDALQQRVQESDKVRRVQHGLQVVAVQGSDVENFRRLRDFRVKTDDLRH